MTLSKSIILYPRLDELLPIYRFLWSQSSQYINQLKKQHRLTNNNQRTDLKPGQVSSVSTPRETGEVMMEQLLFPWHSSSTVLRASAILQENPFNIPSLQPSRYPAS